MMKDELKMNVFITLLLDYINIFAISIAVHQ